MHNTLGLPPRVISEQMGWTLAGVLKLLAIYGHGDVGALDEIDRAFKNNVTPLRAVSEGRGAGQRPSRRSPPSPRSPPLAWPKVSGSSRGR